ncbi:MAG: FUN14 domain-containing protein [Spirochaetes bacterium]|nr:FUN14 domain-containing protein [Spirochaetota bacterium]
MELNWEIIRDAGIGFIAGYILGFLLKKAFKVAIVLMLGFVLFQFLVNGGLQAGNFPSVTQMSKHAGDFLVENKDRIMAVQKQLQVNASMGLGFFIGLVVGLFRG